MKVLAGVLLSCCVVAIGATPRIINGTKTNINTPYMAALTSFGEYFCDGTIISNRWILTAARCLVEHPIPEWIQVKIGGLRLSAGSAVIATYYPDTVIYHENYDEDLGINDIGLLRMSTNILLNNQKAIIYLSTRTAFNVGTSANFFSWGPTEPNGPSSDYQQVVPMKIVEAKTCKLIYGKPINDSQICVMSKPGTGPCYGDLGGPLVADGKQVGIASYARTCATGKPEVFTRVLAHRDWIVKKAGITTWS